MIGANFLPEPETRAASIVALVTSHDRLEVTSRGLASLINAAQFANVRLRIFHAVSHPSFSQVQTFRKRFPSVQSFRVPEDCFWACSMLRALEQASAETFDFLLWMNDDTLLFEDALNEMLRAWQGWPTNSVVAASLCDPGTGQFSYGLARRQSRLRRLRLNPQPPTGILVRGDAANGNALLIHREHVERFGGFPRGFNHNLADIHFTLRLSEAGIDLISPGKFLGECRINAISADWKSPAVMTWRERWRHLLAPTGMPPKNWIRFALVNGGMMGPAYALWPYWKTLLLCLRDLWIGGRR